MKQKKERGENPLETSSAHLQLATAPRPSQQAAAQLAQAARALLSPSSFLLLTVEPHLFSLCHAAPLRSAPISFLDVAG